MRIGRHVFRVVFVRAIVRGRFWCVTPVLSLRNTGLAAARWNFLRYHVVGDSTRRHDDVSRPPATAALVLSSPSIVISMCLLLRC